ncbi:TPA: hypothetical protein ACWYK7_004247 [Escherichia coli]|uniref:hypothetical protein n=1 Tax=Escherichia coli TaxID=562 RepID=UPI003F50D7EA
MYFNWTPFQKDQAWHGLPLSYRALFPVFSIDPYLICARQNVKTAALDLARERQAHEAGARTRATAHERTPQQERQKAAREAERGREAWTLGQGMKKPVAGCYGRLMRWKGGGDVVYMALL